MGVVPVAVIDQRPAVPTRENIQPPRHRSQEQEAYHWTWLQLIGAQLFSARERAVWKSHMALVFAAGPELIIVRGVFKGGR